MIDMEILLSVVAALAVMRLTFSWFFDDFEDFKECLMLWFTPDIIDIFRGQFVEGFWADIKILFWLLVAGTVGYSVHTFLVT